MEEKIFAEKPEEKISITAEEVTDIRLTQAGYYWEAGYNEFDFTCRIEGTEDRIHMVQQIHDEGYGLVIRSERMISGIEFQGVKPSDWKKSCWMKCSTEPITIE